MDDSTYGDEEKLLTYDEIEAIERKELAQYEDAFRTRKPYKMYVVDGGRGLSWCVMSAPKTDPNQGGTGWLITIGEETGEVSMDGEFFGVIWDDDARRGDARSTVIAGIQSLTRELFYLNDDYESEYDESELADCEYPTQEYEPGEF